MRMAKAFIAAIPLALVLLVAVAVVVAVTPGAFGYDNWPQAPKSAPAQTVAVLGAPVRPETSARAASRPAQAFRRTLPVPVAPSQRLAAAPPATGLQSGPPTTGTGATKADVKAPAPATPAAPAVPQTPVGVPVIGASDVPLPAVKPVLPADGMK
jgi:hypothetical protein